MSRIGKKPLQVPQGAKVAVQAQTLRVEGPKGKLTLTIRPEVAVKVNDAEKTVSVSLSDGYTSEMKNTSAYWGTTRALIKNMLEGVTKGYERTLEVVGVGWTPSMAGKQLKVVAGYANPIMMPIPEGLTVTVDKQFVKVAGADRQAVGQFAAELRGKRKPEPYNGKGIKYSDEVIRRKQGKQFGA